VADPRFPLVLRGAFTYSDRIAPLIEQVVPSDRLVVDIEIGTTDDIFLRMSREQAFDVSEMSLCAYTVLRSRGVDDLIAIPVFTSRMFRHASVYVAAASPLTEFEQLNGCTIGVPDYQMTAAVWVRDLLHSRHGVHPSSVTWLTGGVDTPGRVQRIPFLPPDGVSVRAIAPGATLSGLLSGGAIDALMSPQAPEGLHTGAFRRLLADPQRAEEEYFAATGIFPIMHTVVLRRSIYDADPGVARQLFDQFDRARAIALGRLEETDYLMYGLAWMVEAYRRQRQILGDDYWPYGMARNRHVLDVFVRACSDQGLLESPVTVDSLFAPELAST
jgi:4,5-dihydroxyphthalate decarboxylase